MSLPTCPFRNRPLFVLPPCQRHERRVAEGDTLAIGFSIVEIGMPRQRFATLHPRAPTPLALGLNEKSLFLK